MKHSELISLLKPETTKIDQAMRQDLAAIGNQRLQEVVEYAIFNGGKRVRPLLTVLAARLCWQTQGHEPEPPHTDNLYRLALTFEYLHAASLLHDDVIDHADRRRGRTTANQVWDNTHVILAGDFLHARAMLLAGTIGGAESLTAIGAATAAMVESEFLQLENAENRSTSQALYFQVLSGKTAALIAAATSTGAIFAQATPEKRLALHTFGSNLGLTFQIVDDLLDYQGDPQRTGKAVGNDFQEGKMTLPLILSLVKCGPQERTALTDLLHGSAAERATAFPRAHGIIEQTGGFEAARAKATALVDEAVEALAVFSPGPERQVMTALARYVLNREG